MTQKTFFIIIFGLIFCLSSNGQKSEFQEIDSQLTNNFKKMLSAESELRFDRLSPGFTKQILNFLANPVTFRNEFDSLSKYLTIKTSPDNKIKFYSWDDLTGGTWHNINCVAQFETDNGKIIVQQINSGKEAELGRYTDSEIYEVFELNTEIEKLYLTIAWGTHGSGQQHQIVQIFRINGDTLLKCNSCFADNKDLVIEYPRSEKANLTFDPVKNILHFNEFKFDEEKGRYKATGKTISLEFINGVFTRK
ncbi:hypothetical protein [Sediminicola arcticus]|uniref:Uncharacterized protein n=1 Tax=Sediminicola arcticus TaxID=1574308 RepID=A0ABV2SPU5_9FLAO